MKTNYDNNELSPEALNELNQLCGGYSHTNRIQDDFGDTSWIDGWVEEYLQG
jgi:hypothetical protein